MDKVKFNFFVDISPLDNYGENIGEASFSKLTIEVVMCYTMLKGRTTPFFEINSRNEFVVDVYSYKIVEEETSEDWKKYFYLETTEFDEGETMLVVGSKDAEPGFFMGIPELIKED